MALIGDIVTRPWSPSDLLTSDPVAGDLLPGSAGVPPAFASRSIFSSSNPVRLIFRNNLSTETCLQHLAGSPSVFAFPEIIGLDEPRFVEAAQWAIELAGTESPPAPIWQIGLSPHAPYSIHFPTAVNELASHFARRLVTAMHVAESRDERQWLETGSGPFREAIATVSLSG